MGRILDHFQHVNKFSDEDAARLLELFKNTPRPPPPVPRCLMQNKSNFLVTNTMMRLFSENPHSCFGGNKNAAPSASASASATPTVTDATPTATTTTAGAVQVTGRRVVYIAGSWDMFHAGHLQVMTTLVPICTRLCIQCKYVPSVSWLYNLIQQCLIMQPYQCTFKLNLNSSD